jgi:hypothetical protein
MWRIKDWIKHFENNRTKETKTMRWVPIPTKMDGDGFTELLNHPNGPAHYGTWVTLVHVAAKCCPRGTLARQCGSPHDEASLSRITRVPETLIAEVIPRLLKIGWLEYIQSPKEVTPDCGAPAVRLRQDCGGAAPLLCTVLSCSCDEEDTRGEKVDGRKKRAEYSDAYEKFWLVVAPHKRDKKAEGYRRFKEALVVLGDRGIETPEAWLLAKATAYYSSPLGKTFYCNGPAPWLHQGGYDADPAAWDRKEGRLEPEEPEEPDLPLLGSYDPHIPESMKRKPA